MKIDILGSIFMLIQDIFAGVLRLIEFVWTLVAEHFEGIVYFAIGLFVFGLVAMLWEAFVTWIRKPSALDPRRVRNPRL